jgi:aminoglycoside phosphotransferase (APT) family kinase protein
LHGKPTPPVDDLRKAIAAAVPSLAHSTFRVVNDGWDSVAVEAGGWIFKFPRDRAAEARLRRECEVLALSRRWTDLPIPLMELHEQPRLFSQHRKLEGSSLEPADYERLSIQQRDALAATLAGFYAGLHAIPPADARAAGAVPIDPWLGADEVLARAAPALPVHLLPFLHATLAAYRRIAAGPDETVFGYFDGHGWNMAFDHARGVLNGVFDFADSGFGARHQDLSYPNWISSDLTLRIISRYERLTGRSIDRERVMLYSAMLRLVEFAQALPDHADLPDRLQAVGEWFTSQRHLPAPHA